MEWPAANGRSFARAERLALDAGTLERDAPFGACAFDGSKCADKRQQAEAAVLAGGWRDERWEADLGLSQGFEIDNFYGGITGRGDAGPFGLSLSASRRPMSNSLLSYGGTVMLTVMIGFGLVMATRVHRYAELPKGHGLI